MGERSLYRLSCDDCDAQTPPNAPPAAARSSWSISFPIARATSLSTRLPTASSICTVRIAASCCRRTALTASISARLASTSVSSNAPAFRASRCMLFEVDTRSASSSLKSAAQSSSCAPWTGTAPRSRVHSPSFQRRVRRVTSSSLKLSRRTFQGYCQTHHN